MRVARQATIGWGIAQIAVALGAQWVTRSVLDSGLVRAVAGRRSGARRVSHRRADDPGAQRRHARRHGRRRRRARLGLVDQRLRVHVVCAHRRGRDAQASRCCSRSCRRGDRMPERFEPVAKILRDAVEAHAFPAACIEVGGTTARAGTPRSAGLTFDPYAPLATPDTIFDLASLTKVIATTTLAMRAVDAGRMALTIRWRSGCRRGAAPIAPRSRSATCSRTALACPRTCRSIAITPDGRVRAGDLHAAARVRAGHAVDLQRSRLHPARLHPRRCRAARPCVRPPAAPSIPRAALAEQFHRVCDRSSHRIR